MGLKYEPASGGRVWRPEQGVAVLHSGKAPTVGSYGGVVSYVSYERGTHVPIPFTFRGGGGARVAPGAGGSCAAQRKGAFLVLGFHASSDLS